MTTEHNSRTVDVARIINAVLHEGIFTYKKRNSNAALPLRIQADQRDKEHKKGSIFVTTCKENLTTYDGVKGYVITSKETLLEDVNTLAYWTPNVFNYGKYADLEKKYIKGHEEQNLQQINTFVIDIDTKKHTLADILLNCMDHSIGVPTLVLESVRGYQVYFSLDQPLFISSKNNFRGLKVAKRISENIKQSLKDSLDVDVFCNDFGFFRIPTEQNVIWFQEEMTYSFGDLIAWSQRQDDNNGRTLFSIIQNNHGAAQPSKMEWFHDLLNCTDTKGYKGQIGRNNLMFTLALACYSEERTFEDTFNLLDEYNSNLAYPLKVREINTLIRSAFSGKYKGANKNYIESLLESWGNGVNAPIKTGVQGWYKFKKDRSERQRSHYDEWEQDLLAYIQENLQEDDTFLWCTQKEVCKELGIAKSTLNEVLKQSTKIITKVVGKGRAAKTGFSTVAVLFEHALKHAKAKKKQYMGFLNSLLVKIKVNPASKHFLNLLNMISDMLKLTDKREFKELVGSG